MRMGDTVKHHSILRVAGIVTAALLADAHTAHDNAFKLVLVERTLASVLSDAKG